MASAICLGTTLAFLNMEPYPHEMPLLVLVLMGWMFAYSKVAALWTLVIWGVYLFAPWPDPHHDFSRSSRSRGDGPDEPSGYRYDGLDDDGDGDGG